MVTRSEPSMAMAGSRSSLWVTLMANQPSPPALLTYQMPLEVRPSTAMRKDPLLSTTIERGGPKRSAKARFGLVQPAGAALTPVIIRSVARLAVRRPLAAWRRSSRSERGGTLTPSAEGHCPR